MKLLKPLQQRYNTVMRGFLQLGFVGESVFYNICKSVDVTLNGFELIQFYKREKITEEMLVKVGAILEKIKYE